MYKPSNSHTFPARAPQQRSPEPKAVGQLHLAQDGQHFLLAFEPGHETASIQVALNTTLNGAQLAKQETKPNVERSRQTGRVVNQTLLVYRVPADHQNTLTLIELSQAIRQQGDRLTVSNERTRTHLVTHKKLAEDREKYDRQERLRTEGLPAFIVGSGANAGEEPDRSRQPAKELGLPLSVGVKHTDSRISQGQSRGGNVSGPIQSGARSQPIRQQPIRETAPNITILTGHTPATARTPVALKIVAPRHPEHEDCLANGYSNDGLYELIMDQPGAAYVKARKGRNGVGGRAGYFRLSISETTVSTLSLLTRQYGLTVESAIPNLNLSFAEAIKVRLTQLQANIRLSSEAETPQHSKLISPEGLDYLPYQKAGIAYALAAGNALIADEPGLGKTIQAIGVSNALPEARRILIVVPATLKINWQREFEKWDVKGLRVDRILDGKRSSWPAHEPEVVVINFDLVQKHYDRLTDIPWDILVIDEAHALKNEDTKRTQAILGHGSGKDRIPGIPATRKLYLTGTPILSRPQELWTLAHSLDPDFFSDKRRYEIRYCNGHMTDFGWNAQGASNLKELNRQLRARIMTRRLKRQVLKDLPPKTRQIIELDRPALADYRGQSDKLTTATETLERLFAQREALTAEYQALPDTNAVTRARYAMQAKQLIREAKVAFHQLSEVRKENALAKVPQVMELIKTSLDNGKLILFCHHQEVVDAYRDALNAHFRKAAGKRGSPATVAVVSGQTPTGKRQAEADRFQDDPQCQVFIGTIQAAGTGLTLTQASIVLFAELDWVPGNVTQAEDRAHRIGQQDHVLIYHTAVEGSIDTRMIRRLMEKQQVIDEAIEAGELDRELVNSTTRLAPADEDFMDWLQSLAQGGDIDTDARQMLSGALGGGTTQTQALEDATDHCAPSSTSPYVAPPAPRIIEDDPDLIRLADEAACEEDWEPANHFQ